MTIAIHQLLPTLKAEDAIGNCALLLQGLFHMEGFDSSIFVYRQQPGDLKSLPFSSHRRRQSRNNLLLFHTAVASPLAAYFRGCPEKKVVVHHNITPFHYLVPTDPEGAYLAFLAREELRSLAHVAQAAVADSAYNARELSAWDFPAPVVIPLLFDTERLHGPADEELLLRLGDGKTNILFVGKIAPHKKQEDVIRVFYHYHNAWNPASRLLLVGDYSGDPEYARSLFTLVERLGLKEVVFAGKVSREELRACYRRANVFLCLSEHEGFGVPLVESLFYRVPVVAFAAAAVPETLAGAGVIFSEKNPMEIACLLHRLISDRDLRERILKFQDKRLNYFRSFDYRSAWDAVLSPLLY